MRARHSPLPWQAQVVYIAARIHRALHAKNQYDCAYRIQLRLSWNEVYGIMMRAFKCRLARMKKPLSESQMNVYEVAYKRGFVISDRAVALTDDRWQRMPGRLSALFKT